MTILQELCFVFFTQKDVITYKRNKILSMKKLKWKKEGGKKDSLCLLTPGHSNARSLCNAARNQPYKIWLISQQIMVELLKQDTGPLKWHYSHQETDT